MTFRFEADTHRYFDADGRLVPSITQMMQDEGLYDTTFFTEEGRDRGARVHDLCRDWDLGAVDQVNPDDPHAGYLAAFTAMSSIVQPEWDGVETAYYHEGLGFGGRPDRHGMLTLPIRIPNVILEVKSGHPDSATGIQLALQAVLMEGQTGLPARLWARYSVHLKANGRYKLDRWPAEWEIERAHDIIRRHC